MNFEDKTYQKIEDFLRGDLNPAEQDAFLKELETDSQLASKVEAHKLADELVIEHKLLDVKEIFNEEVKNHKKRDLIRKWAITGTAIILGVLLISLLFTDSKKDKNPEIQAPAPADTQTSQNIPAPVNQNQDLPDEKISENAIRPVKKTTTEPVADPAKEIVEETPVVHIDSVHTQNNTEIVKDQQKDESVRTLPEPEPVKTDPCEKAAISATINTTAACEGESEGNISVTGFSGGNAPYSVTALNKEGTEVSLNDLAKGAYTVEISDAKGCSKVYNVQVAEKPCMKEYSFNPFTGETFEIPVHKVDGVFTVYDKAGKTWYSKPVPGGSSETWDGKALSGEMNTGYFMFDIRYSDGKRTIGYITIVR